MSQGYIRNDTANNIADANIIDAVDLDGEFDAIVAAFAATTGHTHDGTEANGGSIEVLGPVQDVVVTATTVRPKTDNVVDLGTSTLEFKDLWIDGVANIDSLVADTADINAGTIDNTTIATSDITVGTGKTLNVSAGTLTLADNQISGDKVEGGTINAVTIDTLTSTTVNATTVDTTNLEVTTLKAKDGTAAGSIANTTGVVTIPLLTSAGTVNFAGATVSSGGVVTTVDINGGTIDNTPIGESVASTVTGITATFSAGTALLPAYRFGTDSSTGMWSPSVGTLAFSTGGAERVRINGNGLHFNGDTTAVNALNDYEEGAFTPTIVGTTVAGVGTYPIQIGRYTKIGSRLSFSLTLQWSSHTGTGGLRLAGLPFASLVTLNGNYTFSTYSEGIALTAGYTIQTLMGPNATVASFSQINNAGTLAVVPMDLAGLLVITGHYETA